MTPDGRPTDDPNAPTDRGDDPFQSAPRVADFGWLPFLSIVAAIAVLMVAIAYTGPRFGHDWTKGLFWLGIVALFLPFALRLAGGRASRGEQVGSLVTLALCLYLVKIAHSPNGFTYFDELLHWHTADDILRSHHLFGENSILPASPLYPGLEIVTTAVASLTGLSIFASGAIIIGVAKIILVLALYLLYLTLSGSDRVATIGTLLYIACPSFVFFDGQFAYESLALPFAVLVMYAILRGSRETAPNRVGLALTGLLALGFVIWTHHVTSYALAIFLVLWAGVGVAMRYLHREENADRRLRPGGMALLAVVACTSWVAFVAEIVVSFFSAPSIEGLRRFGRIITGEQQSRQLFHSYGGYVTPPLERLLGFASVILILVTIPLGLFAVWRRARSSVTAIALAVVALGYPVALLFRFVAVTSSRAIAFLFIALAFVLAMAVTSLWHARRGRWMSFAIFGVWSGVIVVGGIITDPGRGPSVSAFPGPYMVSADARSIDREDLASAIWARDHLGTDTRIVSDRINKLLMASYGRQHAVTARDNVSVAPVILDPTLDATVRAALRDGEIRYVVIDRRLSTALPLLGIYVDIGEANGFQYTSPISPAALAKFDNAPGVSTIFDSGDIVIYDVRGLANAA